MVGWRGRSRLSGEEMKTWEYKLDELTNLGEDWDGYGAYSICPKFISDVGLFLEKNP